MPDLPEPLPDGPTPSFRPDHAATPSFHKTNVTPPDYVPPSAPEPPLLDDAHPPVGSRYTEPKLHKKGGMGRIFTAADSELKRQVALKDIQPKHRGKGWYRQKFIFEAEVTGELEHPGIVPVYGFARPATDDEQPHYAMRFLDGNTLGFAIKEFHTGGPHTSLSGEQLVQLRRLLTQFLAVCQTLAYAHSRGVIHRDLKPDNIMCGPFGETLVVDWGLAKRLTSGETAPDVEIAASPLVSGGGGTPGYWAPEQASKQSHLHDERTDVYGLGAVLFAILTGSSPHPNGIHPPTAPNPQRHAKWVDDALEAIVRKALHWSRDERYQTAKELAEAVERWMADQPVLAQRAAVAELEAKVQANPTDRVLIEHYARQLSNLGQVYQGMGRDAEALVCHRLAGDLFADLFRTIREPRFQAERANCLIAVAHCQRQLGQAAEAKLTAQAATAIYSDLIAEKPADYRFNYATIHLTMHGPGTVGFTAPPPRSNDDLAAQTAHRPSDLTAPPPAADSDSFELSLHDGPPESTAKPVATDGDSEFELSLDTDSIELAPDADDAKPDERLNFETDFELPLLDASDDSGSQIIALEDDMTLHPTPPKPPEESADLDRDDPVSWFGDAPPVPPKPKPPIAPPRPPTVPEPSDLDRDDPVSWFREAAAPPPKPVDLPTGDITAHDAPLVPAASAGEPLPVVPGVRILRKIGEGGMAVVYEGLDLFLGRRVAVKLLHQRYAQEPQLIQRVENEAYFVANLSHPNIVRLHQAVEVQGVRSGVYEYIEGPSLREASLQFHDAGQRLSAENPAFQRLIRVVSQACEALDYAHGRGLLHRDPKPQNILINPAGNAVVFDWGLGYVIPARANLEGFRFDSLRNIDRDGAVVGTPQFMSPEQWQGDTNLGPAADVYALGGTLFFTLTGKAAVEQTNGIMEIAMKVAKGDIRQPRDVRADVPRGLNAICRKAMALKPGDRYATAGDMAGALRDWLRG